MTTTRAPLGEVCQVTRGAASPASDEAVSKVRLVGGREIRTGRADEPRHAADDSSPKAVRLEAGDVVVVLDGTPGTTALVGSDLAGAMLGRDCALVRASTSGVSGPWVYAWTMTDEFVENVARSTAGSTMSRLGVSRLAEFTLPVPTENQMAEAAAVSTELDRAVREAQNVVDVLGELRRVELQLIIDDEERAG